MAVSFSIETVDQSDRWYFVPGSPAEFEVRVCNSSSAAQRCKFTIEEPIDGGSIEPSSAILQPNEPIVLRLRLNASWSARETRVVVAVRDLGGMILATIVRPITTATISDCSVSLGWKEAIVADGSLRGFVLHCFIRNIGKLSGAFQPRFAPHPALTFPDIAPSILTPGEAVAIEVPIIWNRAMRDDEGLNHPRMIEVEVAAGGKRRSASTPWETVQLHVRGFLNEQDTEVLVPLRSPPNTFAKIDAKRKAAPSVRAPVPEVPAPTGSPAASALFTRAEYQPARPRFSSVGALVPMAFAAIGIVAIVFVALQLFHIRLPGSAPNVTVPVPAAAIATAEPNGTPGVKHAPKRAAANAEALLRRITSSTDTSGSAQPAATPAADEAARSSASSARPEPIAAAAASAQGGTASTGHAAARPQRPVPIDRELVVTLTGITAWYGHGGRAVHVAWASTAQASADIQLLDSRNVIVAEKRISGPATAATVLLPPKFRGPVFVAVTAIGYHGERVVQSGSPQ